MPAETFLQRYQEGDREGVWNELTELGEGVRHEIYYADAVAVATETMRRARHNVEQIIRRLADMGYRFVPPSDDYRPDLDASIDQMLARAKQTPGLPGGIDSHPYLEQAAQRVRERMGPLAQKIAEMNAARAAKVAESLKKSPLENKDVFDPPNKNTAEGLRKLESAAGGPLPISLRAWYEQVGGVSLMGSHDVINPIDQGPGDPLVVASLHELVGMIEMFGEDEDGGIGLWLAPDDLHKANVSGGSPYTITIPNAGADAPFENEFHNTTFVNYLRKAFEWGGFPGWEQSRNKAPHEFIAKLTEGLLPI